MKTAILALVLFLVMIFPHELGHFIAAKLMGVQVNEFAFGMGPVIWKKQRGETLHSIRLFPVGGFCAMEGENGEDEEGKEPNPRAFYNKRPWQRIVILLSGAAMNVITALVVMIIIVGISGFATTKIATVEADSPAYYAGIEAGDKVISVNSTEIKTWTDISAVISETKDSEIPVTVLRNKEEHTFMLTPIKTEVLNEDGSLYGYRYVIGVMCKISHNPFKAIASGTKATFNITISMYQSLFMLFRGEVSVNDLSGPVGIVSLVNQTSNYGLWYFGFLVSVICMNLAIVNLLPFPALDGGRIIFVLFEAITKKKVNQRVEGIIHAIGLALLFGLMIFVTWNDISKVIFK